MPAPQKSLMSLACKATFSSKNIKIPMEFSKPAGEKGDIYDGTFKPEEKMTMPGGGIPPLFQPASLVKYHTQSQTKMSEKYAEFIDTYTEGICKAWDNWLKAASVVGLVVTGPTVAGGQVVAPPMTGLLMAELPKGPPQLFKYTNVIATTIGPAWDSFSATIKFPGLPMFPAFAAMGMPIAPPQTPALPDLFMKLVSVPVTLSPKIMEQQMIAKLGDPGAPHHKELFAAVCDAFDKSFQMWKSTCTVVDVVSLVCPVPTFAPPYVPVGPVVGGTAMMKPGGFK